MITELQRPAVEHTPYDIQDKARVLFFESGFGSGIRPEPGAVANLIEEGLTEDVIKDAARARYMGIPEMPETLRDLQIVLPYYLRMSDALAENHPDATFYFAARDAEVLYDIFATAHPDMLSYLLPASMELWRSRGMTDTRLVSKFLGKFGLDSTGVDLPPFSRIVVDSGYRGTVGEKLAERLSWLYGGEEDKLLENDAISVRLIHANRGAIGKTIVGDFTESGLSLDLRRFNLQTIPEDENVTGVLADFAQTMPRYYGNYAGLEAFPGDDVRAVTAEYYRSDHMRGPITRNVDKPLGLNASVVSPVAAAIVQYLVVKAALDRRASQPQPVQT